MSERTLTSRTLARRADGSVRVTEHAREELRKALLGLLDAVATATGRETFYNTKEEQMAAEEALHRDVFDIDRGLYGVVLALPGVNDHATQQGLARLLDQPHNGAALLDERQEGALIRHLAGRLPPQRLFKLFITLRQRRINNRRTRRLILSSILGSDRLAFWAVKYRHKLREALRHALGTGVANGLRTLTDPIRLERMLGKYLGANADRDAAWQCVHFILGGRREYTLPLLRAFTQAKSDLERGAQLPVEVLGGIRSRYHKGVPHARVLELARQGGSISEGQKLALQRSAARHDVELAFDPTRADLVRLYVYALECVMTPEVRAALDDRARAQARHLPVRYERVGIVVDTSASMQGTAQGKYRPLAVALALRDVLAASAREARVAASQGAFDEHGLIRPVGDTCLARAVAELLQDDLDALYLLSDGYENAPAGRVDEVLRALRGLGVTTPVYQLTPVLAG